MPSADDVASLGRAVSAKQVLYELMASFAACTGLRWGELIALTAVQINQAQRVVTVDAKLVEVRGHLYVEAPKNRKPERARRRTVQARRCRGLWRGTGGQMGWC